MKRIVTKLVTVMLAFSLVFSVLALAGCGQDSVEKAVVGTWESAYGSTITFRDDGTCTYVGEHEYRHKGDGNDPECGHYEIIEINIGLHYWLLDSEPNKLYEEPTQGHVHSSASFTRK